MTAVSATADTPGVQINGQTTVNFTFNNNPEWQASGTNNFGVLLTLGKFYDVDPGAGVQPCNIKLLAVVTPLNNGAATPYAIPLSSFAIIQSCNSGITTVAAALAELAGVGGRLSGGWRRCRTTHRRRQDHRCQPERRRRRRLPDHARADRRHQLPTLIRGEVASHGEATSLNSDVNL